MMMMVMTMNETLSPHETMQNLTGQFMMAKRPWEISYKHLLRVHATIVALLPTPTSSFQASFIDNQPEAVDQNALQELTI